MAPYSAPSTQPMFSPAVLQGSWGPLRFYLHFQARSLALALVALSSRSFDRWYLTHWPSFAVLSAGSSTGGASRSNAPPGAIDRADDIPSLWQMTVGFPFNLGHLHIQVSLPRLLHWWHFPRAPSAGGTSHTGALRSALGRWCLQQWHSTALLLADRLSAQLFSRVILRPRSSALLFQKPQITKTQTQQSPNRHPRVQTPSINSTLV